MSPACFSCHRPAARFDRHIGQWICEGSRDCSMSMTPPMLARLLENEHLCEVCRQKMATRIFDFDLVCDDCHRYLERKLVQRG